MSHWEPTTPPWGDWPPSYGEDPPPFDPTSTLHLWEHWRTDLPEEVVEPEPSTFHIGEAICGILIIALIGYMILAPSPPNGKNWTSADESERMTARARR